MSTRGRVNGIGGNKMENLNGFIDITPNYPVKVVDGFKNKVVDILEDVYDLLRLNTNIIMEEELIEDMRNKLDELKKMVESEYNKEERSAGLVGKEEE